MNQAANTKNFGTIIFKNPRESTEAVYDRVALMREKWPGQAVMRRELPLFTRFRLTQADLKKMDELDKGPIPCRYVEGEAQYDKDLLLHWYMEEGYLAEGLGGAFSLCSVPGGWYDEQTEPSPDLNPHEVMMHRFAEQGICIAKAYVDTPRNGHSVNARSISCIRARFMADSPVLS